MSHGATNGTDGLGRKAQGACDGRRARRPPLRRHGARPRAALGASWPAPTRARGPRARPARGGRDAVVSPMQGTVLSVEVAEGDAVEAGQVICIVEAMKMENEVHASRAGVVRELSVAPGEPVATGQVICVVAPETRCRA